jgi:hypothetical protein
LKDILYNYRDIFYCAATMGSLMMGTSISWSGPALPLLELCPALDGFSIDKTQASWVGSLMPLGKISTYLLIKYLQYRTDRYPLPY